MTCFRLEKSLRITLMMNNRTSPTELKFRTRTNLILGTVAALALFLASGLISYINTRSLNTNARKIAETHEVLLALNDVLSFAKDAETGQRGFIITGDEKYLAPYQGALTRIDSRMSDLERAIRDSRDQQARIGALKSALNIKLRELQETIDARRDQGFDAAMAMVVTDRGKAAMDTVRTEIQEMYSTERVRRNQRIAEMDRAYAVAVSSAFSTCLFGIVLSGLVAYVVRRTLLLRQWQDWLLEGQIGLNKVMVGELRLERLGDNVLKFLAEHLDAQAGAFFVKEGNHFRRFATYGVPASRGVIEQFDLTDGLLGQACKDERMFVIRDVPDGYLSVGSSLGQGNPRNLVITPLAADGVVNAVIELGFVHSINESITELLDRKSGAIGIAVRSANDRKRLQNLLEETQRQAEEMQSQGEELRVSNEELEEQSRALKESQTRLELQQAELEQTNSQLEEQTQLLELQRDDASRAKAAVQEQARELEQASQYKSDFLANMSHELRTPLNSSLIQAKLLGDNDHSGRRK
jgi:CHASE3 domain sensor protein